MSAEKPRHLRSVETNSGDGATEEPTPIEVNPKFQDLLDEAKDVLGEDWVRDNLHPGYFEDD